MALALALALAVLAGCGGGGTGAVTVSDVEIAEPAGANAAAYFTLKNGTGTDVRLVAVTTTLTPKVSLHDTVMSDGQLVMTPVDAFTVPAKGTLKLAPGAKHVMLEDVQGLQRGTAVTLNLKLDNGMVLTAECTVASIPGGDMSDMPMDHEHG